jgi:hypothetical protein
MRHKLNNESGPKGTSPVDPRDIRFRAIRVMGHLRRLATAPALQLAGDIDAALTDVTRQGKEAEDGHVRQRLATLSLGDKTVRVTPALIRFLTEMHLLLSVKSMIRERLQSDPDLADLEELLR